MSKRIHTPPAWQRLPLSEALARMPKKGAIFRQMGSRDDEDGDDEGSEDAEVIYFDGDTTINLAQWRVISDTFECGCLVVVNGSLFFEGNFSLDAWIRDDLHCDVLYGPDELRVGGTVFAKHYAFFSAEDHEILKYACPMGLQTSFVFAWFHDVSHLQLVPGTVLDVLCGGRDYGQMTISHPHFFWNESLFALKPELCHAAESDYSDAPYWKFQAIKQCLAQGESLFIDGFDPASLSWKKQADALHKAGDLPGAFAACQRALALSPAWYPAWYAAGLTLFLAGAYEQAQAVLQKAMALFPPQHKNIENMAADYAALCAVRLRQLDLAVELATFSIESTQANHDDQGKRYLPYRIRGEAHMLGGDWDRALADLTQAAQWGWANGVTNWLLGRVHHQLGNNKQAQKYQAIAMKMNAEKFAVSYALHGHADFSYKPPTTVAWANGPALP